MLRALLLVTVLDTVLSCSAWAQSKLTPVDEAGYTRLVAAHKGKVVLVDFWATWCKPCRAETPAIVAMAGRLAARGLDVVTISNDEPESEAAALKFLRDNKVPAPWYGRKATDEDKFAALVDPKWDSALPALVLYDRSGKRVRLFVGETPTKEIEAAILKLL